MLYLIYCVGRFASDFVHRSAYYISLRLTACPIYCVLVLHLLGSTRTRSSTGANLIFLSVFYIYGLRSSHRKGWMQRPRSTSVPLLCSNRCLCPGKSFKNFTGNFWVVEPHATIEVFQFYSWSVWIHLCRLVPGGILQCPTPNRRAHRSPAPSSPCGFIPEGFVWLEVQ